MRTRYRPFAAAMAGALLLAGCNNLEDELPPRIEVGAEVTSVSNGFFIEGCRNAVFRLSESTAKQLKERGIAFLREAPASSGQAHRYSEWIETPVELPEGRSIFDAMPVLPCGEQSDFPAREIESALRARGSFYALTDNGEGMLLVAPRQRLAAVFYVG